MALRTASALVALLVALCVGHAHAAAPDPRELRAGFAVALLDAPERGPLGGYGGAWDRRATHGEIPGRKPQARALLLARGAQRVGIVTLDIVIVRPELRDAIAQRVRSLELDPLLVIATHTHSGPGGYIEGFLAERLTSGSFDPAARESLVESAARALRDAAAELAPAKLAAGLGSAELARNRRDSADPVERELPVIRVEIAGAAPLLVFAYGAHPTALTARSRAYSSDYIGAARAWLEARGWRSLFLPGPLGDQAPREPRSSVEVPPARPAAEPGEALAEQVGAALAQSALEVADELEVVRRAELASASEKLTLPPLKFRRFCALWWLAPMVRGGADRLLSEEVTVHSLALGPARIVALPAEPTSAVGTAIRSAMRAHAAKAVPFVVAHTGDWIGYSVTADRYERGGYESCLSFHGPDMGARLVEAAAHAAQQLPAP